MKMRINTASLESNMEEKIVLKTQIHILFNPLTLLIRICLREKNKSIQMQEYIKVPNWLYL